MLRDAGVSNEVMDIAKQFTCEECLQRGRRHPTRPSIIPRVYNKWEWVSMDTSWWRTPKETLKNGGKEEYFVGLSMMDESTDYHSAIIIRTSRNGCGTFRVRISNRP